MKKKVLISIGLCSLIIISLIIINYNKPKRFMYDGAYIALNVIDNGVTTNPTTFPSTGTYKSDIDCTNATGKWIPVYNKTTSDYETKFVLEDITGPVTCFVTLTKTTDSDLLSGKIKEGTYTNFSIVEELDSNDKDAGLRFQGQSPNNYVWFNNEMWRIIGLVPACLDENCGVNGTRLVKIIRNDSIGALAYDAKTSEYTGIWGSNTLYTLLNSYYYGISDGTSSEGCYSYCDSYQTKTRSNCDYRNIGIKTDGYYGSMIQNVYWYKGDSSYTRTAKVAYNVSNERKSTITTAAPIGLMNASDWGYASLNGSSTVLSSVINSNENWLFNDGYELTSTSYYTDEICTMGSGGHMSYIGANHGYAVRPVLYLKTSVKVIAGTGEINNPYILGD